MINFIWLLPAFCIGYAIGQVQGARAAYQHAVEVIDKIKKAWE